MHKVAGIYTQYSLVEVTNERIPLTYVPDVTAAHCLHQLYSIQGVHVLKEGSSRLPKCLAFLSNPLLGDLRKESLNDAIQLKLQLGYTLLLH